MRGVFPALAVRQKKTGKLSFLCLFALFSLKGLQGTPPTLGHRVHFTESMDSNANIVRNTLTDILGKMFSLHTS